MDLSCRDIVGGYLLDASVKERKILYRLAQSDNLWEQRIAIVSTWMFIKYHQFDDCLQLSQLLVSHPHDLIHKAIGWMLPEVGKKDITVLQQFLQQHYDQIPRTTLRYAIERFDEPERQRYLKGLF